MGATIRDVARLAGVSHSTVSRVLNDKGTISEETKQRIYVSMEELKYVPNDFARSFASGSPHTIALVIDVDNASDYANYFFNNTVFGIETAAHRSGYNLMVTNGSAAFGGTDGIARLVAGKRIDGIVFPQSIVNPGFLQKLEELQFPSVILGRPEDVGLESDWVDINNTQAGAIAVRHLIHNGYRRIAFVSDGDDKVFNQDRIEGYRRELTAEGIAPDESLVMHGEADHESGCVCAKKLLEAENRPDTIICSNDKMALGVLRTARAMGICVPQELGLVCCDNTVVTELARPDITSIDVDTFELGLQVAEILINRIENAAASIRQILLSTRIIERESTAKKRKGGGA